MAGVERFELPDDGVRVCQSTQHKNYKITVVIFIFRLFPIPADIVRPTFAPLQNKKAPSSWAVPFFIAKRLNYLI